MGKTVIDRRGGRPERWVLLPEGVKRLMQVPETMRKAVVFLYYSVAGEQRPAGTGLLAVYPVPGYRDHKVPVLLTADHVIRGIRSSSDDRKVLLRVNTRAGAQWVESSVDQWHQGAPNVDCAFLPAHPTLGGVADHVSWELAQSIATDRVIRREAIGLGDEVFVVGLFRNHLGRDRNEPILRVGNLAAMPVDPIRSPIYGDMRAILIEARSIGGLSGAPVFVHMGFARWREGEVMQALDEKPFLFLGLMHGHWEAFESDIDSVATDATGEKINMGIGVVVPAQEVMRSIGPVMKEAAEMKRKRLDEQNEPVPDTVGDTPSEYEQFEDLTRKLVNVPKPEVDEKRKDEA